MGSSKQWLAAIDQLFDAVGREQRLAQALGELRPIFGAQAASFFTVADPTRPGASHTGAVGISVAPPRFARPATHETGVK